VTAELAFMLAAIATFGMPGLGWALAIWVASECVQIPVTTWLLRRATGYGVLEQFAGVRTPLLAALAMALGVTAVRAMLPPGLEPPERLLVMVGIGAPLYSAAIALLDRGLAGRFFVFVQSAFQKAQV